MSIETILALVIGVLALYFLYVLTKKLIVALFFGAFVSTVLFIVIPALTHRDDAVGKAARMVDDLTQNVAEGARDVAGHPDTKALVNKAATEVQALTTDTLKAVVEKRPGTGGTPSEVSGPDTQ